MILGYSVRSNTPYAYLGYPCAARQLYLGSTRLEDIQCGDCIAFREAQGVREYVRGEEKDLYIILYSCLLLNFNHYT